MILHNLNTTCIVPYPIFDVMTIQFLKFVLSFIPLVCCLFSKSLNIMIDTDYGTKMRIWQKSANLVKDIEFFRGNQFQGNNLALSYNDNIFFI